MHFDISQNHFENLNEIFFEFENFPTWLDNINQNTFWDKVATWDSNKLDIRQASDVINSIEFPIRIP